MICMLNISEKQNIAWDKTISLNDIFNFTNTNLKIYIGLDNIKVYYY